MAPIYLEAFNLWVRCRRRFFFLRKMAPIFLEALNLWVRCRRRLFFSRKMAPRFPDAAGAGGAGAGRILRSQPDPSPNAPRDQIRRKDPCCDMPSCCACLRCLFLANSRRFFTFLWNFVLPCLLGVRGVGKWPPYIWKPLICGYVAAGAFFFSEKWPPYFWKP